MPLFHVATLHGSVSSCYIAGNSQPSSAAGLLRLSGFSVTGSAVPQSVQRIRNSSVFSSRLTIAFFILDNHSITLLWLWLCLDLFHILCFDMLFSKIILNNIAVCCTRFVEEHSKDSEYDLVLCLSLNIIENRTFVVIQTYYSTRAY